MKYLFVALYHPRVMKGGAQYVAKDLFDAAIADDATEAVLIAGIDVNIFPAYGKVGAAITELPEGINEYLLLGRNFNDFYHTIYDPRRNKAVQRCLEHHRPDVIHVHHSLWVGLDFIDLARRVLPDVRIIYTLHEYLPICYAKGQLFRYHEQGVCHDTAPDQCVKCFPERTQDDFIVRKRTFRRAFEKVDRFIAPSAYLKARFVEWGVPDEKVAVVPNGHNRRRPQDWTGSHTEKTNVFGFFGQYIDAKGIDVLLTAACTAAKDTTETIEIRLFGGNKMYASPEYIDKIDSIVSQKPDNVVVTEVGPYSRDNVFDLMTSVDWEVVPSIWPETFVLVVSEAWDARRPVIASEVGALAERIVHGRNGLSFTPGSATELARLIRTCIGNSELWRVLSERIRDEISVTEAWNQHVAIARELLGGEERRMVRAVAG